MKGWVCNLLIQLRVTLGPKSHRTHDQNLFTHLRLPQPGKPGPVFISPRTGWPSYTGYWAAFCPLLWLRGIGWRHSDLHPLLPKPSWTALYNLRGTKQKSLFITCVCVRAHISLWHGSWAIVGFWPHERWEIWSLNARDLWSDWIKHRYFFIASH